MKLLKNLLGFFKAIKKGDMSDFLAENMKDTIEEYIQKGIDYYENQELDKAKEQFELVLSIDEDNKDANHYMQKINIAHSKSTD
jgi:Tfp pilus assembly protein PilF